MPTADEIMRRVEQADTERIKARAAAAGRVGEVADECDQLAEKLAEKQRERHAAVLDATKLMTLDELSSFTDRPTTEVEQWAGPTRGRKAAARGRSSGRSGGTRRRSAGTDRARTAQAEPAATEPAGVKGPVPISSLTADQ